MPNKSLISEIAHSTLFRGNSVLTKALEKAMTQYGSSWLEKSLGEPLRTICDRGIAVETDPGKRTKGLKDHDQNMTVLTECCSRVWNSIYAAREDCPP